MTSERDKPSGLQFSVSSLLVLLTLAAVSFATLRLGWVAVVLVPAFAAFTLALMGKSEVAFGIIAIMIAVGIGIVAAIVIG